MELFNITYQGPPVDNEPMMSRLPTEMQSVLRHINGFIQFRGGLHIRGCCSEPRWHSLALMGNGERALHRLYPVLTPDDVPFGQDALGDQFVIRDGVVCRLLGETGELDSLDCGFVGFLERVQADPVEYLGFHPLIQFEHEGGMLIPGHLLTAYPPFCSTEPEAGVSLRALPAFERIEIIASLAAQLNSVANGQQVRVRTG